MTNQTIIATSSRGVPDYLRSSLDRTVLIEQVRSPSQQCDELLSLRSQAQELLNKLKTRVRRRRFEWIFVSVAGLVGAILSVVLADLWKPWSSELFALVPIVLGAVVWFFATLRASVFARRKALLEFDSKVLEKYIKTRLELLESQTHIDRPSRDHN